MKPATDLIELDIGQIEETLDRIEEAMGEETVRPLRLLLTWCLVVAGGEVRAQASWACLTAGQPNELVDGAVWDGSRWLHGPAAEAPVLAVLRC